MKYLTRFKEKCLKKINSIDLSYNNIKTNLILREELIIDSINQIDWLKNQDIYPKFYWKNRDDDLEFAGIGYTSIISGYNNNEFAECFDSINNNFLSNDKIRYIGGICFDFKGNQDKIWNLYRNFNFYLPKFELIKYKDCFAIAYNLLINKKTDKSLLRNTINNDFNYLKNYSTSGKIHKFPNFNKKKENPDKNKFENDIHETIKQIKLKNFEKIVLAKRLDLTFEKKLSPLDFISYFKNIKNKAYLFCFQNSKYSGFIGCSPERLYKRNKNKIFTEALAGTRLRGEIPEIDKKLENDLLSSEKDIKEHLIVHNFIKKSLKKICKNYSESKVGIKKFVTVQHILTKFEGYLNNEVKDIDIIKTLHPTPAVCGLPLDSAKKLIKSVEIFDRGWYAGPVGWMGKDSSEFSVAIRSGIINQNILSIFCGAGIIEESNPEEEVLEIETKFKNFLNIIGLK